MQYLIYIKQKRKQKLLQVFQVQIIQVQEQEKLVQVEGLITKKLI